MSTKQASTALKHLVLDKYVIRERVHYRGDMDKLVYHMTPLAAEFLKAIGRDYDAMEKQLALESVKS